MKKVVLLLFSAVLLSVLNGCCTPKGGTSCPTITVAEAAPGEIVFDGKVNEKFWQKVPAFELVRCDASKNLPPRERDRIIADGLEKGTVKFAFDDKYFYVAAILEDNDLIGMMPSPVPAASGDTFGITLVPENATYHWTFYSAPNKTSSAFFHKTPSLDLRMQLKGKYGKLPGFECASSIEGTLNRQTDKDKFWTTEMRIPLSVIAKQGINFAPGEKWMILASRFNFSAYNYAVQTSSYPELPAFNFGMKNYFARVIFR